VVVKILAFILSIQALKMQHFNKNYEMIKQVAISLLENQKLNKLKIDFMMAG